MSPPQTRAGISKPKNNQCTLLLFPWFNPYSRVLWAQFAPIFRKMVSRALRNVFSADSKYAGKSWSWRSEWWVKCQNPTLWRRRGGFGSRLVAENLESQPSNFFAEIRHSRPPSDFQSHHVGARVSDFDVWPTIRCARIRAFKRTSKWYRTTHLRPYGALFVNFW